MEDTKIQLLSYADLIRLCENINQFEDIQVNISKWTVDLYTLLDNETCNVYSISLSAYKKALILKTTKGRYALAKKWHREDLIDALKHPVDNASEEVIAKIMRGIEL